MSALTRAARDIPLPVGRLCVDYETVEAGRIRVHHQRFRDGRLTEWAEGRSAGADLTLRQSLSSHTGMLERSGDPMAGLLDARVVSRDGLREVPPVDELVVPWGAGLPTFEGVGLVIVHQLLTHSPFGDLPVWFKVEAGAVIAAGPGRTRGDPDIYIRRRYRLALMERAGAIDVLESLDGGAVVGSDAKLLLFLGALDREECRAARRGLAGVPDAALGTLGEVLSSPGWERIAERIRAESDRSEVGR